jgi:hypothetical protein
MKLNNLTVFSMIILSLASGIVGADDDYSPAEYQPKDSYTENYVSSAAQAVKETAVENSHNSAIGSNEQARSPMTGNAQLDKDFANAPASNGETRNERSLFPNESIVFAMVLVAVGAFLFRSKLPWLPLSNTVATVAENSAERSTGVERYIEKLAVRKTGVAKYLDRQAEVAPATTVTKYLAKQIVRDKS